jgi:RNA polymerase sigma-70 factor, ECF subfamily
MSFMNLKEREIISGLHNGVRTQFDYLFKCYYSGLCIYANSYLKSFELSEEVVQEVFVKLWENHDRIIIHTSLKAYLYRSVFNTCLNFLKINQSSSHKHFDLDQPGIQLELMALETSDSLFSQLFSEQVEKDLEDAIAALPEQCRTIFKMCRYENLSYPEISSKLNVSLSTVKTQMSRAMEKLLRQMEKYF